MKLISYNEAMSLPKLAFDQLMIPIKVRRAKKQAELEKCKIEEKIAVLQSRLQQQCYESELDFGGIIELQDEIGLLERKLMQFDKIISEMFGDDKNTK